MKRISTWIHDHSPAMIVLGAIAGALFSAAVALAVAYTGYQASIDAARISIGG